MTLHPIEDLLDVHDRLCSSNLQLATSYDSTASWTSSNLRDKAEAGTAFSLEVSENDLRLPLLLFLFHAEVFLNTVEIIVSLFSMSILKRYYTTCNGVTSSGRFSLWTFWGKLLHQTFSDQVNKRYK